MRRNFSQSGGEKINYVARDGRLNLNLFKAHKWDFSHGRGAGVGKKQKCFYERAATAKIPKLTNYRLHAAK